MLALSLLAHLRASQPLTATFSLQALSLPVPEAAPSLDRLAFTLPSPQPMLQGDTLRPLLEARLAALVDSAAERTPLPAGEVLREGDEVLLETAGHVGERLIPDTARQGFAVRVAPGAGPGGLFGLLAGHKVGERLELDVTLPQDFPTRAMAGARARFSVHVLQAARVEAPLSASDAAVLEQLGLGTSREEALALMSEELEAEYMRGVELAAQEAVLGAFASRLPAPIPPELIDADIRQRWEEVEGLVLEQQGATEAQRRAALESFRTLPDLRAQAERRLRLGLALRCLAEQHGLKLTPLRLVGLVGDAAPGFWPEASEIHRALTTDMGPTSALVLTALLLLTAEYVLEHAQVDFQPPPAASR
jgi:trigger factor